MIKCINITNFGKLSDVRISPSDNLNIIYAPNEGGKSTLLEFIKFIFYGSRRKKVKGEIPFREKYMPWNGMPMSGSIELDYNGNSYIIYRSEGAKNGSKQLEVKNPGTGEIYPNIDDPGQFFFGVNEKVFSDTFLSGDTDTFFEPGEDIAAIVYGMDDSHFSYNKIRQRLEEQILDLSSPKRSGSDFSRIQNEIHNFEEQVLSAEKECENLNNKLSEDLDEKDKLKEKYEYLKSRLNIMQKNEAEGSFARILTLKQKESDNLEKLLSQRDMLNKSSVDSKDEKTKKSKRLLLKIPMIFCIIIILVTLLYPGIKAEKQILPVAFTLLILFALLMTVNPKRTGNKKTKEASSGQLNEDYDSILSYQIELSKNRLNEYEEEIKNHSASHNLTNYTDKTNFDITNTFTKEEFNGIINKIHTCEIDMKVLDARIKSSSLKRQELLADKEYYHQKLSDLNTRLQQLDYKVKVLRTALSLLDSSFFTMRDSVAPKISQRAFEIFDKVSGSGYTALVADDKFEASINIDGKLKSVKNFSRSTRDLADLALRIAICDALSGKYSLPLFFDDILSSFDDERSSRMLDCIRAASDDRQIFLCTCRTREIIGTDPAVTVIRLGKDDNNG